MKYFNIGKKENIKTSDRSTDNKKKEELIQKVKNEEQEKAKKMEVTEDISNVTNNKDEMVVKQLEEELNSKDKKIADLEQELKSAQKELKEFKEKDNEIEEKLRELGEREKQLQDNKEEYNKLAANLKKEKLEFAEETRKLALDKAEIDTSRKLTENREKELADKEKIFLESKKILDERAQDIKSQEINLDNELNKRRQEAETIITQNKHEAFVESERIKNEAIEISNRLKIETAEEIAAQRGMAEKELLSWKEGEIKALTDSYKDLRIQFDKDLASKRQDLFNEMTLDVNKEKEYRLNELENEIATKRSELENERTQLKELQEKLENEKEALKQKVQDFEKKKEELEFESLKLEKKQASLDQRYNDLDQEVFEKYKESIVGYQDKIKILQDELDKVTFSYKKVYEEFISFQDISTMFPGESGKLLMNRLSILENEKSNLEKELADRPHSSIKEELAKLKDSYEKLNAENVAVTNRNVELQTEHNDYNKLKAERDGLDYELNYTKIELENARNKVLFLENEVKRLSSSEVMVEEYEKRLQDIRQELVELKDVKNPVDNEGQPNDEIQWLNEISKNCFEYGIAFPKRILYAFHTALKISDWSTITVLAGVSGTGKSELPRLYSIMGRVNFINVPVQPNWDSQESMLGYYNSIDNKFDAQPALRFLVECTEKLDKCMGIVLLDEMNLAHVEYYFAEFLSKLELRRGSSKSQVPSVEVKLGAGVPPYKLMLKRNILWCGTMNQDETTKSLSDKVLDRGIVINFPRPKSLKGRSKMGNLEFFKEQKQLNERPMLSYDTWTKWRVVNIEKDYAGIPGFKEKQLKELVRLRGIVENINNCLGIVGRALGHRVWQSIEFYIANYPEVIAAKKNAAGELTSELKNAIHIAFEDQLVQKVMPKLRGIDTRGTAREKCLDPIKQILISEGFNNLESDFDRAMQLGYGQFMWCSADFIDVEDIAGVEKDVEK